MLLASSIYTHDHIIPLRRLKRPHQYSRWSGRFEGFGALSGVTIRLLSKLAVSHVCLASGYRQRAHKPKKACPTLVHIGFKCRTSLQQHGFGMVYVYIYMQICTHFCVNICVHMCVYVYLQVFRLGNCTPIIRMHIHMNRCLYIHMYLFICLNIACIVYIHA